MQSILKFILIAVTSGVICYIAWAVYGEGTRSASARMSESVQIAHTQSQNMSNALALVSSIGSRTTDSVKPQNSNTGVDEETLSTSVQVEISEITNLQVLLVEWKPRYEMSKVAYAKFDASISNAKNRAADYFAQQKGITESMRDPVNRSRAEQEDEAETLLYKQWEARADLALQTAANIGIQLDDMNANFEKMKLRKDFAFEASTFQRVPEAISELNEQLADFQTSSEYIKSVTGSPFQAEQK